MSGTKRFLVFFIFLFFFVAEKVEASCSVSVAPNNVVMGVSSVSHFSVSNTGDQLGNWVRIESPDLTAYTIAQSDSEGWYGSGGGTRAEFAGGYLESGATGVFDLTLAETGEAISSMNWEALVSYDAGENFESCGAATIQVVPAPVAPQISGVNLTVGNSSATLTWNTNLTATGAVNYGTTSSYGSSVVTASGTTHLAGVTGLSASTEYHYQIQATSEGGTTSTADATFTTSAASVTTTTTTTVTNTVTTTNTNTVTKIITDTTAPVVKITELGESIFESAPIISGTASDDRGMAKVEYSLDEVSWIGAGMEGNAGDKKVSWEAVPSVSLDGTYIASVRAVDVFGNKSIPKKTKFVIDRLPPTIGGAVVSVSGIVLGARNGVVQVVEGLPVLVTMKELGGSEKVIIEVDGKQVSAVKDKSTSIWNVELNLSPGIHLSKVIAEDGAGKKVERNWITFEVAPKTKVTQEGSEITNFEVELWRKNTYGIYTKWESKKEIGWVVPAGEYYLLLNAGGVKYFSQVINFGEPGVIAGKWELGKTHWWNRFLPAGSVMEIYNGGSAGSQLVLDTELVPKKWYGTQKIIYVFNPDLPYATEGLMLAQKEATQNGFGLVVVGLQASQQEMEIWSASKTGIDYMADWEGKWLQGGALKILPTKYYLDTFGKVVKIKEGVY